MIVNRARILLLLAALTALAACSGDIRRDIGIERTAPDEFQVIRRKPLIIPPDASLRPPAQGSGTTVSTRTAREARQIATGGPAEGLKAPSRAEAALLAATQVQAIENIRTVILEESTQRRQLEKSRFLYILGWQRRNLSAGNAIDPAGEAARLEAEGIARKVVTIRTGSTQSSGAGF